MGKLRILITGGGTGGHLFPALAIGDEIKRKNHDTIIHYVGSKYGLESKVYPIKDVLHTLIPIRGIQRKFNISNIKKNLLLPFNIISSISKVNYILNKFQPQIIIGTGGYASAIPILMGLRKKPVPYIVIQEQNSYPGLTNKFFAKDADLIFTAFTETGNHLDRDVINSGNPIRFGISDGDKNKSRKFFQFNKDIKVLFLFGGSQGSSFLNNLMEKLILKMRNIKLQILWQTGDTEYLKFKKYNSDLIRVTPFIHNMADAYSIADLIICRSGALTISEITICGKPSILIPLPSSAANHQLKNARVLEKNGASFLVEEKKVNINSFFNKVIGLTRNKQELKKMSAASKAMAKPNSTKEIVQKLLSKFE